MALLPWLGGCTESTTPDGAWWFAALALLVVAASAFVLGRLIERQRNHGSLRAARAALRQAERLQAGWSWQTDAQHRLVTWRSPGQAQNGRCSLFDSQTRPSALVERLQSQQPFSGLHLHLQQRQEGGRAWLLSGVPRHDDQGAFNGFVGTAQACDESDAVRAGAAAAQALLDCFEGPALLAQTPAGSQAWLLAEANAPALAQWPLLKVGAPLSATLPGAPTSVVQAWATLQPGERLESQGWRLAGYGPLPGDGRGLLITLPAANAAAASTPESDNFSFTVSHDLRAPIRVVEGFTRIVKEDYGAQLDRVGNDHLDRVLGAAARMNQMIDALLTLAKLSSQPLAQQPVNLSQLAGYVVDDLRRSAPERLADFDIQAGLVARGDPTLLRLVLENLLGNAWKYSAKCNRALVSLHSVAHGPGAAYVVRDNGAGFDMRSADRLFGLFQRLHSTSEFAGTGVGLASVRRIVHRHGGEIWAESEPGRGAAFFFTLAG